MKNHSRFRHANLWLVLGLFSGWAACGSDGALRDSGTPDAALDGGVDPAVDAPGTIGDGGLDGSLDASRDGSDGSVDGALDSAAGNADLGAAEGGVDGALDSAAGNADLGAAEGGVDSGAIDAAVDAGHAKSPSRTKRLPRIHSTSPTRVYPRIGRP